MAVSYTCPNPDCGVTLKTPNRVALAELAAHAIRLAKLDDVYRALDLDPTFEEADPEDVEDLLIVPRVTDCIQK